MNRRAAFALFLIVIGALVWRVPQLDRRLMHNDEAVNAIKFRDLWRSGRYLYDPNEHHGPTLPYATVPAAGLSFKPDYNDLSEATYRSVAVFFGAALILLLALFGGGLGTGAVLWAGLFTAVSPAMVFYSRYYIHEMLLVFFTLLTLGAGWRYICTRQLRWCVLAVAGLALMQATKETFVLAVGSMVVALIGTLWWARCGGQKLELKGWVRPGHLCVAAGVALLISITLFTSFYTNPHGPLDSIRTYFPWLNRAAGQSPHVHPWHFYLHRLVWFVPKKGPIWTEIFIVMLALIGMGAAVRGRGLGTANVNLARFIVIYTVVLTVIYSVISYKTPWCLLGFYNGMILLAGLGAAVLGRLWRGRLAKGAVMLALVIGTGHLGWEAWAANFPYCNRDDNPYNYVPTSPDLLNLVKRVEDLAAVHPDGSNMVIKVMAPENDYWPLPWYLRRFKHVGWWTSVPADPYAPVMIVSSQFQAALDENPGRTHLMVGYFQLRSGFFFELYVQFELWEKYLAAHPPPTDQD